MPYRLEHIPLAAHVTDAAINPLGKMRKPPCLPVPPPITRSSVCHDPSSGRTFLLQGNAPTGYKSRVLPCPSRTRRHSAGTVVHYGRGGPCQNGSFHESSQRFSSVSSSPHQSLDVAKRSRPQQVTPLRSARARAQRLLWKLSRPILSRHYRKKRAQGLPSKQVVNRWKPHLRGRAQLAVANPPGCRLGASSLARHLPEKPQASETSFLISISTRSEEMPRRS